MLRPGPSLSSPAPGPAVPGSALTWLWLLPWLWAFAGTVPSARTPFPCLSCRSQLRPASSREPTVTPSPGAGASFPDRCPHLAPLATPHSALLTSLRAAPPRSVSFLPQEVGSSLCLGPLPLLSPCWLLILHREPLPTPSLFVPPSEPQLTYDSSTRFSVCLSPSLECWLHEGVRVLSVFFSADSVAQRGP